MRLLGRATLVAVGALAGACGSVQNVSVDGGGDDDDIDASADPDAAGGIDAPPPDPMWTDEIRIGHDDLTNQVSNFGTDIAVDASGNAIVVFYDQGEVWARRYVRATDTWDPLQRISESVSTGVNPRVDVDDAGNAMVAWYSSSAQGVVYARRFDAASGWTTGWGTVATVAGGTSGVQQYMTGLDMTSDGHAAVTFYRWNTAGGTYEVWAAVFEDGGGWTAPVRLSTAGGTGQNPAIGVARMGTQVRVVAAWSESAAGRLDVHGSVSTYDTATNVLTPGAQTLLETENTRDYLSPRVMMDEAGNALVVFQQRSSTGADYHVISTRYAGGSWSGAMAVDTSATDARDFAGAMNGAGMAVVVWRNCNANVCSLWGRRNNGGNWLQGQQISEEIATSSPSVAVDGAGRALALWRQDVAAVSSILASELDPQSGWSAAHTLEVDNTNARQSPRVAFGKNGTGVAGWVYEVDAGGNLRRKIQGAIYKH